MSARDLAFQAYAAAVEAHATAKEQARAAQSAAISAASREIDAIGILRLADQALGRAIIDQMRLDRQTEAGQ